jgi:hypothetical protein
MARTIIISASDAAYFYLLSELLRSVEKGALRDGIDLGVLDLGLEEGQRDELKARGVKLCVPELDYDAALFRTPPKPAFRAMTARPHLPHYFPGYDLYIFLDADCWVQDWEAVRLYATAALRMGVAVTPETDRSYTPLFADDPVAEWRRKVYLRCFGEQIACDLSVYDMINTGLFASRADSVLWENWSRVLGIVYGAVGEPLFYAEQTVLNTLIRSQVVPAAFLPARCNWMCNRALPVCGEDGTMLHEPQPPFDRLGIIHLTGPLKNDELTLTDLAGGKWVRSLRFRAAGRRPELTPARP